MEGIVRWNKDRATAATQSETPEHRIYSGHLKHAVEELAEGVLEKRFNPALTTPKKYTGMYSHIFN